MKDLGITLNGTSSIDRDMQDVENQLLEYKQPASDTKTIDPSMLRQWQELRKSVITKEAELDLFKRARFVSQGDRVL